MSGRVGDLSVKQAEALAQVNYVPFFLSASISGIYLWSDPVDDGMKHSPDQREATHRR